MCPDQFDDLLRLVEQDLMKYSIRDPVSLKERLVITLVRAVFLATGSSQQELAFRFHRGRSTISGILSETCKVLWKNLSPLYLRTPSNATEWLSISKGFQERWNFPNCVGSIDGKHFRIKCPNRSGSTFFNYKSYFSSLVLAVVTMTTTSFM